MDSISYDDIHHWVQGLQHVHQWQHPSLSTTVTIAPGATLKLIVTKSQTGNVSTIRFFIGKFAHIKPEVISPTWKSKPITLTNFVFNTRSLSNKEISSLLINFIEDILGFFSKKSGFTIDLSNLNPTSSEFKDIFNLCFVMISFIFLTKRFYQFPEEFMSDSNIHQLHILLSSSQLTEASKKLMQILGFNLEVEWMGSMKAAYACWNQSSTSLAPFKTLPCSISFSTNRFWKVQLLCPIMALKRDSFGNDKFLPSLNNYQIEGVFQLHYRVIVQEDWIDVVVNVDNIRIDVLPLIQSEEFKTLEIEEKHFPSRVLLNLTPIHETNVMSVSISQSSDNPTTQLGILRNTETSFQSSQPFVGLKLAAGEAMSTNLKPWRFEESAEGNSAIFDWVLHDAEDGRKEVYSSELPKKSLINPKAWFRGRYSNANRPFVKQGGVVFAGDMYGQPIQWRIYKNAMQNTTKWELKGKIWLTYWPNKIKTSYHETRSAKFKEILDLTIP